MWGEMSTLPLTDVRLALQGARTVSCRDRSLFRLILVPLLFFAVHGAFSFQSEGSSEGGFAPGAVATRNPGILGYVVLPAIAYGIVTATLVRYRREIAIVALQHKTLTVLAIFTICSALWSQNTFRSAYSGLFYLLGTLFAYFLLIRFTSSEICSLFCAEGVLIVALSLFTIVFFPQYGLAEAVRHSGAWKGIFIDRSGAAKCFVFLLSPALIALRRKVTVSRMLYVLVLSGMTVAAQAVTPCLVLAGFIAFLLLLSFCRRIGPRLAKPIVICLGISLSSLGVLGFEYLPDLLIALGRDPTLTGRTAIWSVLWQSVLKHPFLGYGFYSFWLGLEGESGRVIHATNWTFGYAHNGYLEIVLQLGFVGIALFVMTLFSAFRDGWTCFCLDKSGQYDWYLSLLFLTLLYNLDEGTVLFPSDLLSILYVVACCGLSRGAWMLRNNVSFDGASENGNCLSSAGRS
jgi:exopolysaccharide production protein ExoQ